MRNSKLLARIVLSSSTYQVVLHMLHLILFCQRGSLIRFSSSWFSVMSLPNASVCRTAICSSPLFPGFHWHIPCTSLNSSSFPLFHSLCLSGSVFVCFPVKVLSIIVLTRSRHSSLCGFVALPCDASAAQPGQPPVCP